MLLWNFDFDATKVDIYASIVKDGLTPVLRQVKIYSGHQGVDSQIVITVPEVKKMGMSRREFMKILLSAGGTLVLTAYAGAQGPVRRKSSWEPAYMRLEEEGLLAERVEKARAVFEDCALCPRKCGVNRLAGEKGFCRSTAELVVYSHQAHFGEELPLVGRHGSGTIFFSNCNLRCVFCQNWPIAHEGRGRRTSDEALADMMLDLQRRGCRDVNLVTPTHVMPGILAAVRIALKKGLRIPLCYNTGGYERVENIRLLDGIVDIYLPDLKFMDGAQAALYAAAARNYPEAAKSAIVEMNRQVGDLETDGEGRALRGLMIRHLVMPNRVAGTREFVAWAAKNLSKNTYINIMAQYRVEHRAFEYPLIARAITVGEFLEAMEWAEDAGLVNLDARSVSQRDMFRRRN